MTRIAAGHPGIWPDICAENRTAIVDVLDRLLDSLGAMRQLVAADDRAGLLRALQSASTARRNLPARISRAADYCEVRVPVPDRKGVLAEVTTMAAELDVDIADLEIAHSSEGDKGVLILVVPGDRAERLQGGLMVRGFRPSVQRLESPEEPA
jgi:prephenate dehydrogenase